MKNHYRFLTLLLVLFTSPFFTSQANAQCGIKLIGPSSGCAPFLGTFERINTSGKKITSVAWNFSTGTSNTTDSIVQFDFKSAGTYTVHITVIYSDNTKCTSTLSTSIVVNGPPKAKLNLPTGTLGPVQCFKRNGNLNSYSFTQSSTAGTSGAAIVKYLWNFGDGDTSTAKSPTHSYQAPGTYNISLRVVDANGCQGYDTILGNIIVLKDLNPNFTINSSKLCNRDSVKFYTDFDTSGLFLKSFYWNFGDGSVDSISLSPSHIFGPGTYKISFTLVNKLGCTETSTQTLTINRFRINVAHKDTLCWSYASRYGITFSAEQQTGVSFWQWNFGDPNSGQADIDNYAWVANHRFVGGPGNYLINFSITSSTCGTIDTCFIEHIIGPQAIIDLSQVNTTTPFPLNNYYPVRPIPRSDFIAVNANKTSCGLQTITYIKFRHTTNTSVAHVKYKYCHADTVRHGIKADTIKDCYGRSIETLVTSINLIPTDSTYSYYIDSTQDTIIWTKGSPIPSGKVYYPSSGTLTWNAIHDSNLTTCQLPNLVRFTNNSIKHRLYSAIDDNTFLNVLDPKHSFQDTCKWKNYPMASDSLSYYWSFNDPSGTNCTSTASNKNWDCNFSTEVAPYHYFKGKLGAPPSGVQTVRMRVTDPVTGCSDSTTIQLKQGPPKASWDKSAYCKMTWEMQQYQLTPKGSPGPNGPPLIGFMLANQMSACSGPNYQFRIDLSQTLPTSGANHWWIVFDSANVVKYKHCSNPNDSTLDYGFLGDPNNGGYSTGLNGYPAGGPDAFWQGIPWQGNYWYQTGDSGCKTIGIVLQTGNCYDTAWYHNYICFNKIDAGFNIYNVFLSTGAIKSMTLVNNSISFIGHICQPPPTINWTPLSSGGTYDYSTNRPYINEGLRLYLYPKDTNQNDITSFQYNMTRNHYGDNPDYSNNGGQWYYSMAHNGLSGFWPDSASLNTFTTTNDSIGQVKYHVNYIDTPNIYVIIPSIPGLPSKRLLLNFPIYGTSTTGELDSLLTNGQVNISLSDSRARRISADCGKPYVTVYTNPGFKVTKQTQILRLGGPNAADSFMVAGQSPQLSIPYPGFYTINSQATNLEGCEQSQTYYLVYGHYATFWVDDSIICLGQPTTVHWYVRYWSTNCPPPPGGGPPPPGCLNGADEQAGISNSVDFAPWNFTGAPGGPTGYRDTLTNNAFNSSKPAGYQPEQIWFNMGGPGDTLFHRILVKGNSYSFPPYSKPGVYTVTMKTVDWRGCNVFTQRRNLMNVIQVKANFGLEHNSDTLAYCAPRVVPLYDSSTIVGNSYKDQFVINGKILDTTIVADSIKYQIWNTGFGAPVTRTGTLTEYFIDYPIADTFGIRLSIQSGISGCSNTIYKPHLVKIIGPTPGFEVLGNSSGCFPFTAHVRVISHDIGAKTHLWNFGDPVKQTNPNDLPEDINSETAISSPGKDSLWNLAYDQYQHGGRYRLTLTETDSFTDLKGNHITCTATYPLPEDSVQHFITVFPNSPIRLKGNGLLLNSPTDTMTAMSNFGEYRNFVWNFGNGSSTTTDSDSVVTFSYTGADIKAAKKDSKGRAIFVVTVTGTTKEGCTSTDSFTVLDGYSNIEEAITGLENLNVYPNPFSTSATVEYQLDKKSKVSMDIMDITGKSMASISQSEQVPGKYKIDINAEKYHLTPGVYLLKITLDNGFSVRHIIKM